MKLTFLQDIKDFEQYVTELDKQAGVKLAHIGRPPSFPCFVSTRSDTANAQHDYLDYKALDWMNNKWNDYELWYKPDKPKQEVVNGLLIDYEHMTATPISSEGSLGGS